MFLTTTAADSPCRRSAHGIHDLRHFWTDANTSMGLRLCESEWFETHVPGRP